jgi:hypothetical protein
MKSIGSRAGEGHEHQQTVGDVARQEDGLCAQCKKLDFSSLFRSDYRSPEPDGDCFSEINSLGNINSQKSCPFCRILSEVVASRHFDTKGKTPATTMIPMRSTCRLKGLTMLFAALLFKIKRPAARSRATYTLRLEEKFSMTESFVSRLQLNHHKLFTIYQVVLVIKDIVYKI